MTPQAQNLINQAVSSYNSYTESFQTEDGPIHMVSIHDSVMNRVSEAEIKEILATEHKPAENSYFGDFGLKTISEKLNDVKDANKTIRF